MCACVCVSNKWNILAYIKEMIWSHEMESNPHNDKIEWISIISDVHNAYDHKSP